MERGPVNIGAGKINARFDSHADFAFGQEIDDMSALLPIG